MQYTRNLPQDPFILLSYINTKLRDEYDGLDVLCQDMEVSEEDLSGRLKEIGYEYDGDANQFIRI